MTATGNLLGTAVSGLLAYQRALAVTGHNTTNVNTPGYSRQRIELGTRPPLTSSAGFIGNGVDIDTVSRYYDQFVTTQLRATTSGSSRLDAYYAFAKQIDNVVADSQTGLMPALQSFFNAVSDVANNPSSTATRQVMLSQAEALVNRFHYMNDRMDDLETNANTQIRGAVAEINSLTQAIGQLNQQIYELEGIAAGQPPNDLLDQRDEALRQLSERLSVSVVTQDNGMLSVFAANGQTLVLGTDAATLSVLQNEYDPENLDVGLSFKGGAVTNITDALSGGTLGGALEFRDGLLETTRNELGRLAVGLSEVFNAQHQLGLDQSNLLGGDFFADLTVQTAVESRFNNAATDYVFTGTVTDVAGLKASDYRVEYNAGTYTVTRLSDNTIVGTSAVPTFNLTATEGFTISSAGTTISNGDSFVLRLTSDAAGSIGVQITQASQIAAAGAVRATATLTNTGSGTITQGSVTNSSNLPLAAPITLTFDPNALGAGVPGFTVTGGPGGTLAYNPATEGAGKSFTFAAYGGYTFTVAGTPAAGDTFVIQSNAGGFADNRNALALAGLQSRLTMLNGATGPTASIYGAYSKIVSDVGARTKQAEIDSQAQGVMLQQAQDAWSNKSGVNLDEEAANLIKYQQIYQASAQLVVAASTVFDTLLAAVRR
jgi:flagellar hook-associated protein 1 FlgK